MHKPLHTKLLWPGGPAGGNGGNGGHIWAVADTSLNSLSSFRQSVHFRWVHPGNTRPALRCEFLIQQRILTLTYDPIQLQMPLV